MTKKSSRLTRDQWILFYLISMTGITWATFLVIYARWFLPGLIMGILIISTNTSICIIYRDLQILYPDPVT
jgi:hypothetical protein